MTMERVSNGETEDHKIKNTVIKGSNEERILSYVKEHRKITNRETHQLLGVGEVAARNILRYLLEEELIKWIGKSENNPQQYYITTE
ncbi:hypothetical protein [Carnobacterium maltaromaticum]|uniref:hypothetical protein n=1 Tax=Carnobacterium maltaromaticum TaxID=2751 RepID=UPI00295EB64F|nr:hypothetical protein [Carnobacterium maltaromaticum]